MSGVWPDVQDVYEALLCGDDGEYLDACSVMLIKKAAALSEAFDDPDEAQEKFIQFVKRTRQDLQDIACGL